MEASASIKVNPTVDAYISGVTDGSIIVGGWIKKAIQRHLRDLQRADIYFDPTAANYVIDFCQCFCIPSAQATPIQLMPWQQAFLAILYGWKRPDGTRRFRRAYLEIAKKNGKTGLAAALSLYHLIADGELTARVFVAATALKQARECFMEAVAMRDKHSELQAVVSKYGQSPVLSLYVPETNSRLSPMTRGSDSQDGAIVSAAILDELHRWKMTDSLWSILRYGGDTRKQPMLVCITTAGASANKSTLCWGEHEYGTRILDGMVVDDEVCPFIFSLDSSPHTEYFRSFSVLKEVRKLCTCAQTTQIDQYIAKAYAITATTSSGKNKKHKLAQTIQPSVSSVLVSAQVATTVVDEQVTLLPETVTTSISEGGERETLQAEQQPYQDTTPSTLRESTGEPTKSTNYQQRNTTGELLNRVDDVPVVEESANSALTTSMGQTQLEGCSATTATQELDFLGILRMACNGHSPTCKVATLSNLSSEGVLSVKHPADDIKDPENWVKPNPSLGSILPLSALQNQYREALGKPTAMGEYKRYRLNIWTDEVSDPALEIEQWDDCCIEDLTTHPDPKRLRESIIQSLKGRLCFGGVDLAPKIDTSALVLVFPPTKTGEKWAVLEYFWCPADNISERVKRDKVPYDLWAKDEFIVKTPGNLTDVRYIADQIAEISKQFDLKEIAYDDAWSSELVRMLGEAGFPMSKLVSYPQSHMKMNAPCQELMRKVLREEFAHADNPVMRWQMSNLRWNTQKGTGFIKPARDRKREKIDGCASLIMALARATDPENQVKKKVWW